MSRLRIAGKGGAEHFEAGFAKTARLALEQALAEGATVLAIGYETPAGFRCISVPAARAVTVGLHSALSDHLYPDLMKEE
jgi:hypothetical protein